MDVPSTADGPLGFGTTGVASKGTSLRQQDVDPFCKQPSAGVGVGREFERFQPNLLWLFFRVTAEYHFF